MLPGDHGAVSRTGEVRGTADCRWTYRHLVGAASTSARTVIPLAEVAIRIATVLLSIHLSITWTPFPLGAATCRTGEIGVRGGA